MYPALDVLEKKQKALKFLEILNYDSDLLSMYNFDVENQKLAITDIETYGLISYVLINSKSKNINIFRYKFIEL